MITSGGRDVVAPPCCAALSRRRFGRLAAGAAGLAVGATVGLPTAAQAHSIGLSTLEQAQVTGGTAPKPIPGGITIFNTFIHHYGPPMAGPNRLQTMGDQSQITDFDGIRSFEKGESLATNGLLHDVLLDRLHGRATGVALPPAR